MRKQSVQEYLGVPSSWPIKETVKYEIILMPSSLDMRGAKKGDPRACVLHNTACRVFNIPNCAIGGRTAYIPQRDERGRWYIAKMIARRSTERAIEQFDKTGEIPEGGFRFIPLRRSHKLAYRKSYDKARKAKGETHESETPTIRRQHKRVYRGLPRLGVHQ